MKRKRCSPGTNTGTDSPSKEHRSAYIADSRLVSRVEEYLAAIKSAGPVNMDLMAEDLQAKYTEYARKKKIPFRKAVRRAYIVVSSRSDDNEDECLSSAEQEHLARKQKKTCDSENVNVSSSESVLSAEGHSISSDNMNYVEYPDANALNSCMTNMYAARRPPGSCSAAAGGPPIAASVTVSSTTLGARRGGWFADGEVPPDNFPHAHSALKSGAGDVAIVIDSDQGGSDAGCASETELPPSPVATLERRLDRNHVKKVPVEIALSNVPVEKSQEDKRMPVAMSTNRRQKRRDGDEKLKGGGDGKKVRKEAEQSSVKFCDIGGCDATLVDVCKLLVHMKHPEVYQRLGVSPPRGFLLHGPPGCGKTLLAHAIAGELQLPFIKLAATEVVSGVSGESEEKIRGIFNDAVASAPCILFLDEIDAITPKREVASKDMERRIVSQLLSCMDDLNKSSSTQHVLVIGATNRPDALDPALRRAGRFDREISVGIPDENARVRILEVLCRGLRLSSDFDFLQLARLSPGYVGADLVSLTREAAVTAVDRVFHAIEAQRKTVTGTRSAPVEVGDVEPTTSEAAERTSIIAGEINTVNGSSSRTDELSAKADKEEEKEEQGKESEALKDKINDASAKKDDSTRKNDATRNKSDDGIEKKKCTKSDSVCDIPDGVVEKSLTAVDETRLSVVAADRPHSDLLSVLSWLKDTPPLNNEQLASLSINMEDFKVALGKVQPSAKREGFATVPDVTWDDIGALTDVRDELQMAILAPVKHPEHFQALGLTTPSGVLLAGPPGCGKTLLAKAVANESGINFISVKGPELLNMYVGESEKAVRQVFLRARDSAPCVIFFDELDALCPRRTDSGQGGGASVRVVNQLLTEMDGMEKRRQVFIMGATNRPDIIDPAVLRPGRLDKILYVGLPSSDDCEDILRTITKNGTKPKFAEDVDIPVVTERCKGFTGADLAALVREAGVTALREFMQSDDNDKSLVVRQRHFDAALQRVKPSVSTEDERTYLKIQNRN